MTATPRANPSTPRASDWVAETVAAAVRCAVGPAASIVVVEPLRLWPLAFGITVAAIAWSALVLAWARLRKPHWLASPWAVTTPLAFVCIMTARPWLLETGWPITVACFLLWLSGPLWVRVVRAHRAAQLALWTVSTGGLWLGARAFVGLYPSLHITITVLGLALASFAAACALPARLPKWLLWSAAPALLASFALSFTPWASGVPARALALTQRSITPDLLAAAWALVDIDNDGAATVWGGADCAALDPERGPGNREIPGDGIDQDCSGSDRPIPRMPQRLATPGPAIAKSVVVITGDSLRFDALGAYGREQRPITPHLDAWARRAVRFERAYATSPETRTSLPVLLWGRDLHTPRAAGTASLAARVREDGFRRARAVMPARTFFDDQTRRAGFQVDVVDETDSGRMNAHVWGPLSDVAQHGGVLWVHYHDPHAPYVTVPGIDWGSDAKARYLGLVTRLDRAVGELLTRLPPDAAVIFASDHGEAFGEHGMYYHRSSLYDEQIRVPLLVAAPGIGSAVITQTVGLIDVYATVLELLGIPGTPGIESRSLVPALRGETLLDVPYRASTWSMVTGLGPPNTWIGLFYRHHKLLRRTDWNIESLYDLRTDPQELHPNPKGSESTRDMLQQML